MRWNICRRVMAAHLLQTRRQDLRDAMSCVRKLKKRSRTSSQICSAVNVFSGAHGWVIFAGELLDGQSQDQQG